MVTRRRNVASFFLIAAALVCALVAAGKGADVTCSLSKSATTTTLRSRGDYKAQIPSISQRRRRHGPTVAAAALVGSKSESSSSSPLAQLKEGFSRVNNGTRLALAGAMAGGFSNCTSSFSLCALSPLSNPYRMYQRRTP